MPTREIARSEWKNYFDEFSRTRAGELVTVELISNPQADPQYALIKQPLIGITYDEKDGGTFDLSAGNQADDALTHTITNAVHVYHKNARGIISDEINEDEVIEITSTDDPRIVFLRFAPAT